MLVCGHEYSWHPDGHAYCYLINDYGDGSRGDEHCDCSEFVVPEKSK